MTSVEVLQTSAEALRKSLSAGNPSAAEISAVRTNVQPAFLSGPGTRESLARLHTQIDNHVRYLDGIGNARNAVQNSTLTELQQLSTTLTGQGILERHVNVDTGNPTLNTGLNRVLNGPYEIARRVFNASSTTAHYVSLGAGALGLYTAWRFLKSMGGRAYRGVRRATSGWFGTAATIGATVAGVLGIQHFMGNRASAAPPVAPAEAQTKTHDELVKRITEFNANANRMATVERVNDVAPYTFRFTLVPPNNDRTQVGQRIRALGAPISTNYTDTPASFQVTGLTLNDASRVLNALNANNLPGLNVLNLGTPLSINGQAITIRQTATHPEFEVGTHRWKLVAITRRTNLLGVNTDLPADSATMTLQSATRETNGTVHLRMQGSMLGFTATNNVTLTAAQVEEIIKHCTNPANGDRRHTTPEGHVVALRPV